MEQSEQPELQGKFIDWVRESISLKLFFIGILILVLLIPSSMIQGLINERAARQDEVLRQVSDDWSGSQLIAGPVLIIPYKKHVSYFEADKEKTKDVIEKLYILPDALHIKAGLKTEVLHKGIYQVVVYNTLVNVSGNFAKANLGPLNITADQLILDKAKIVFSISDLKGLKTNPVVSTGEKSLPVEPALNEDTLFTNGLQANVDLSSLKDNEVAFNYSLDLKGSQELNFLHLGKTTDVEADGDTDTPDFGGRYLPDTRTVKNGKFSARWHMLYYNRPYPQQWIGKNAQLDNPQKQQLATFGVKLRLPVDQYQKTTRTSKYALLIIILTFISLFLTEVIRKQRIPTFNYLLIGAAMVIYYTLLLSFSEQIGFDWAYLVASVATITLITVFIGSLLKNKGAALLFGFILLVFYIFIYVIIQLEDLALMMGSIALFVVIAVLMYFSRFINWGKR